MTAEPNPCDECARLRAINAELLAACRAVEEWWLREGMHHFHGAPAGMFMTRAAIARALGGSQDVEHIQQLDYPYRNHDE